MNGCWSIKISRESGMNEKLFKTLTEGFNKFVLEDLTTDPDPYVHVCITPTTEDCYLKLGKIPIKPTRSPEIWFARWHDDHGVVFDSSPFFYPPNGLVKACRWVKRSFIRNGDGGGQIFHKETMPPYGV